MPEIGPNSRSIMSFLPYKTGVSSARAVPVSLLILRQPLCEISHRLHIKTGCNPAALNDRFCFARRVLAGLGQSGAYPSRYQLKKVRTTPTSKTSVFGEIPWASRFRLYRSMSLTWNCWGLRSWASSRKTAPRFHNNAGKCACCVRYLQLGTRTRPIAWHQSHSFLFVRVVVGSYPCSLLGRCTGDTCG